MRQRRPYFHAHKAPRLSSKLQHQIYELTHNWTWGARPTGTQRAKAAKALANLRKPHVPARPMLHLLGDLRKPHPPRQAHPTKALGSLSHRQRRRP